MIVIKSGNTEQARVENTAAAAEWVRTSAFYSSRPQNYSYIDTDANAYVSWIVIAAQMRD